MSFPIRTDRPTFAPAKCVVLGKADDPVGWIDLGNIASVQPDPRAYLSHGGLLTAARLFDYDIPALVELPGRIAELEAELEQAQAELELERQFHQAVDVIESADFRARRKPGRPKEKV